VDEESIRRRWTSYIKDLYADNERNEKAEISARMDGHEIATAEIQKAIFKMKSRKVTGSDGIEFELVNALGGFGVEKIAEIANHASSIFIAIPKISGTIECKFIELYA